MSLDWSADRDGRARGYSSDGGCAQHRL